jgi:hypothetical protein
MVIRTMLIIKLQINIWFLIFFLTASDLLNDGFRKETSLLNRFKGVIGRELKWLVHENH